jgi:hypothetical protein
MNKRMGRPTKAPKADERVSLGLRVTADIKRRLDEAAERSGRSQSQEAEFRLERSFERQTLLREILVLVHGPEAGNLFADIHERGHAKLKKGAAAKYAKQIEEFLLPLEAKK